MNIGILIVIFILLFLILIFSLIYYISEKNILDKMQNVLDQFHFTIEEIKFLREVIKITKLENCHLIIHHQVFEQAIDKYIKKVYKGLCVDTVDNRINLIYSIRKKLGFFRISPYISIKSTRNIERGSKIILIKDSIRYETIVSIDSELCLGLIFFKKEDKNLLKVGDNVKCSYFRQKDAQYYFESIIKRISKKDEVVFIEHTTNIVRKQLRKYIRLDITIPIKFFSNETDMQLKPATILNLSAGGALMTTKIPLTEGNSIVFDLKLPNHIFIKGVMAKVLECRKISEKNYKVRLKFEKLQEVYRDTITKFILKKQSKDRIKFN